MKVLIFSLLVGYCLAAGQWREVSVESEGIREAAKHAVESLSGRTNSPFHSKLVKIHRASQQVVAGMNYRITVSVGYTKCKKNEVEYHLIESCEFRDDVTFKMCSVQVFRSLSQEYELVNFKCDVEKSSPFDRELEERTMFADFVAKFAKTYGNAEEKEDRFRIFQENLMQIKLLNKHERGTAKYGVTKFSDLTAKEFRSKYLGFRPDLLNTDEPLSLAETPTDPIPESFDWRDQKVVTEVKDQGQCGSCWAFSTTGNIEGQWAIKKKKLVSLSEQELVDCDKVDQGCDGGLPSNAYKEIIRLGGLEGEKDYPYEGEDEKCQLNKTEVLVYINNSLAISQNETEMAAWLVKNGPISIGINANAMQFYYGGISHPWKFLCSPKNLDHGVLIVGYGVHTYPLFKKTLPFWIIKNSWGAAWGEQDLEIEITAGTTLNNQKGWILSQEWQHLLSPDDGKGYYRVYRGDGTCGLNLMATSAVVG